MFLNTVSAGWSSRDSDGAVCAAASPQKVIRIANMPKAIARLAPQIRQAFCRFIRILPGLFRLKEHAQSCFSLFPRTLTTSWWAARTQQICGEALSGWGQTDQGKARWFHAMGVVNFLQKLP
jgi:hypothetical protein